MFSKYSEPALDSRENQKMIKYSKQTRAQIQIACEFLEDVGGSMSMSMSKNEIVLRLLSLTILLLSLSASTSCLPLLSTYFLLFDPS